MHSERNKYSLEKRRHIHDPADGLPEQRRPFHLETDEAPKHLVTKVLAYTPPSARQRAQGKAATSWHGETEADLFLPGLTRAVECKRTS
jgi:hypothetical protein